ncbi:MAG: hypothetical protein II071_00595, partial [Bacteroidales bacterium]|nr:hypothetical protein [Bacteroidales bacterium]
GGRKVPVRQIAPGGRKALSRQIAQEGQIAPGRSIKASYDKALKKENVTDTLAKGTKTKAKKN